MGSSVRKREVNILRLNDDIFLQNIRKVMQ